MSDSREQREHDEFEAWVDALDPDTAVVDDPADLRAVADAADELHAVQSRLREAVHAARANGRTWTQIAVGLGVSRQAATKRYANEQRVTSANPAKIKTKFPKMKAKAKAAVPRPAKVSHIRESSVTRRGGLGQTTRKSGSGGSDNDTQRRDYDIAAHDKRYR
ncbi:hypothetical protein [Terrabacter sp. Soil810]|uniref:hypothetical protein n=1 Tax=Terrabacter sp. Soil810 TaxID=1736418 RepID=UPI000AE026F5|nr:hypothetical protein [Terrabacter sp. Soil810]